MKATIFVAFILLLTFCNNPTVKNLGSFSLTYKTWIFTNCSFLFTCLQRRVNKSLFDIRYLFPLSSKAFPYKNWRIFLSWPVRVVLHWYFNFRQWVMHCLICKAEAKISLEKLNCHKAKRKLSFRINKKGVKLQRQYYSNNWPSVKSN